MVANGRYSVGVVEVIDLKSEKNCSSLPDYPIRVTFASGALLEGSPVICGGRNGSNYDHDECYIYNASTNEWELLARIKNPRSFYASVIVNNALWITGGFYDPYGLDSSEYVFPNGTVTQGPTLTAPIRRHCIVQLLDGKMMILGGDHPNQKRIYIYDFNKDNNKVSFGPDLVNWRMHSACTVFTSKKHDGRPVVMVAGGWEVGDGTYEMLDYTKDGAVWELSE